MINYKLELFCLAIFANIIEQVELVVIDISKPIDIFSTLTARSIGINHITMDKLNDEIYYLKKMSNYWPTNVVDRTISKNGNHTVITILSKLTEQELINIIDGDILNIEINGISFICQLRKNYLFQLDDQKLGFKLLKLLHTPKISKEELESINDEIGVFAFTTITELK